MISQDLSSLAAYLEGRANRGELLDRAEMRQLAAVIGAMLGAIRAMEGKPVPHGWRVVDGGRCSEPPPRIA
jgi:hypothetical protein